ncbi:death-associated inhibitor of apoptosis 2-like, partial [Mercenaria mercenaria]|uniref:death-associated inhibitor of apoptosis 2-like n=1 Tax=Mercenaria mercenaria TaxID=6596 RepID=UPI00234F3159
STAIPKHTQYATKTAREGSYSGWPDTASHTPQELAEAGFFYAGFGDCVRCFYCGIGLRHWTKDDNPWIEHARWSRNCVFVKQKKGEEFVNLVQLAVQYSQDNEAQSNSSAGNQLPAQEVERILLSDAAQSVLEMGYQPRIIKKAIEQILRQDGNSKITAQFLMEKVLEIEEAENPPQATAAPAQAHAPPEAAAAQPPAKPPPQTTKPEAAKAPEGATVQSNTEKTKDQDKKGKASIENKDKKEGNTNSVPKEDEAASQDPKAIKAENEQLKEQTLCKVCLDNTVCIVFLPCGHLVTCADCAPAMRKCPICRALVKGTVRTYMS